MRDGKDDKKKKRSKRQDSRYNADSNNEWKPQIEGNYNNINSHNISGSYNVVNQKLGHQSIYSLTPRELADEWVHSGETIDKERKERLSSGAVAAVLTALLGIILYLTIWRWDLASRFVGIEGFSDFHIQVLASLFASLLVGALSKVSYVKSFARSRVEQTNRKRRKLINDRVKDLGVGAKEWKQLKQSATDKRAR